MTYSIEELIYALYHFPLALTAPFISWYFFFGLSERDYLGSGLIIAIPYFFLIFSTGIFGRISDKIGSKNLVLISLAALSVSFLCYFIIQEKILFFLLYIGFNIVISAFIPAFNRLMSFYSEEIRAEKFGRLGMTASAGFFIGSIFASWVFMQNPSGNVTETFRFMFPIAMIIAFFTFVLATKLRDVVPFQSQEEDSLDVQIISLPENNTQLDIKASMKPVFVLLVIVTLINISSSSYTNFFTIFVQDELKQDISFIAVANSIATLFGVLATYLVGKIANMFEKKYFISIATVVYTLFPLSIYIFRDPSFIFLVYCLPFYSILFVIAPIVISENSVETERGRAMGLYVGSQYAGLMIGTLGGAVLASITSLVSYNFLVGTFIGFLGIMISVFLYNGSFEE
ncbi:MAG: MFS transporter [Candidatus Heimdallarchaeota archaeon]|nr:MAG: MFS transporter [Candidatus Heimdallarchaeota archaeon]